MARPQRVPLSCSVYSKCMAGTCNYSCTYISAGQSTDESSDSNDGVNSNESSESDGM